MLPQSESELVCESVGKIPMPLKVVAGSFSPSEVEERSGDKSAMLEFLADSADLDFEDRLLRAYNLSFMLVKKECQILSLLLYKFHEVFYKDDATSLITPGLMKHFTPKFDIDLCLKELSLKSFIERKITYGEVSYNFHLLIRGFMNITKDHYNMTAVLYDFWCNYFSWRNRGYGIYHKPVDAYKKDLSLFLEILDQNSSCSYQLSVFFRFYGRLGSTLFTWDSPQYSRVSDYMKNITIKSEHVLLLDCDHLNWTHSTADISKVINAYTYTLSERTVSMDKLKQCKIKVEVLHALALGNSDAMEASSLFHNYLVEKRCNEQHYEHDICNHRWQYRLMDVQFMIKDDSNVSQALISGLHYFSLLEDDQAVSLLWSALNDEGTHSIFQELHDSIAYITLYRIYSRGNDTEGVKDSLDGIRTVFSNFTSMSCYSHMYGYVVLPFLHSVKETGLASRLCSVWIDIHDGNRTGANCMDPYNHYHHTMNWSVSLAYSFCDARDA